MSQSEDLIYYKSKRDVDINSSLLFSFDSNEEDSYQFFSAGAGTRDDVSIKIYRNTTIENCPFEKEKQIKVDEKTITIGKVFNQTLAIDENNTLYVLSNQISNENEDYIDNHYLWDGKLFKKCQSHKLVIDGNNKFINWDANTFPILIVNNNYYFINEQFCKSGSYRFRFVISTTQGERLISFSYYDKQSLQWKNIFTGTVINFVPFEQLSKKFYFTTNTKVKNFGSNF